MVCCKLSACLSKCICPSGELKAQGAVLLFLKCVDIPSMSSLAEVNHTQRNVGLCCSGFSASTSPWAVNPQNHCLGSQDSLPVMVDFRSFWGSRAMPAACTIQTIVYYDSVVVQHNCCLCVPGGATSLVLDAELVAIDRADGNRLKAFQELSTRARGEIAAHQVSLQSTTASAFCSQQQAPSRPCTTNFGNFTCLRLPMLHPQCITDSCPRAVYHNRRRLAAHQVLLHTTEWRHDEVTLQKYMQLFRQACHVCIVCASVMQLLKQTCFHTWHGSTAQQFLPVLSV